MTRARDQLRRARSLIDDLEAVVWEADASGRFTYVSAGAERLLGYPLQDWSAAGFLAERVHADDRRGALGAIASAAEQSRPFDIEFRVRRRDGRIVWMRDLGRPVDDGREPRTRGLLIDVSRHRLEDDRHAEIELRYQRLVEQLPAIVYTESAGGDDAVVLYVSPQIRTLLGVDPAEWIGSPEGRLSRVHDDDRDRLRAVSEHSYRTGQPFAEEYRMRTGDGGLVWFHDEAVLVRDDDGRPLFWQGVMLDVTDQRRAIELEAALAAERAESEALRELDELKNTFLQAVSHDLRTPLAAILGLAITLERDDIQLTAVESRDLAARIASNARKLDRIVSDLLDLDRIGRGIVEPNVVSTDVGALVGRIVADSDLARQRPVVIDADPVVADVDPPKVERIVENLLVNTARHTPTNARVWVRVCADADGVLVAVEDDGPGIPSEHRDAIFEPFNRGEERADRGAGVGIGLALVARFAALHGGRAWVQDREGGGASFRVWLPARAGARTGAAVHAAG